LFTKQPLKALASRNKFTDRLGAAKSIAAGKRGPHFRFQKDVKRRLDLEYGIVYISLKTAITRVSIT